MPNNPQKTTVHKVEPATKKYHLGFAPELINIVKKGEEVITYRFGNKYDYLIPGDLVTIENTLTHEKVGQAKIISKGYTTFIDLPLAKPGHKPYKRKEDHRKVLSGYYAYLGREIKDDDSFISIEFKLEKN